MGFRESWIKNERGYLEVKIGLMQTINPATGEVDVDYDKMKSMSTEALRDLYNDMAAANIKRFASRKDAERRMMEEAKKQGKWVEATDGPADPDADAPESAPESAPEAQTGGKKGRKGAGKPKAAEKPTPEAVEPTGKAAKKGAAKAPPKEKEPAAPRKGRGAPVKNPTVTAADPKSKTYNPKGFKPQATSDRMVVLEHIRANKGQRTRDQIVAHFSDPKKYKGDPVNVDAALYYLIKYGFVRASE